MPQSASMSASEGKNFYRSTRTNIEIERAPMQSEHLSLWEDDKFVYVPEEFFNLLPKEYRDAAQALKQTGENVLRIADKDIQHLIRLINAIPTTASLSYIYHRLRTSKFEATAEALMEQETLTTAFIVTYARLFVSRDGASGISKNSIPVHLRPVHDEIMHLRNKRYAHNDSNKTVHSSVTIDFDDRGFQVKIQMSLGLYIGGRNEWQELITFIDAHMHDRLKKILCRLKKKTGYEWTFPSGPAPAWVGSYG